MVELIRRKKLVLNFVKVKVHSKDTVNDLVDSLVKEVNRNNDRGNEIIFKYDKLRYFNILPKFSNLVLDENPRSVVKFIQEVKASSEFLNLRRNTKYRILEIHWPFTFAILQSDEISNETSFNAQFVRRKRIRLLFEELTTTQQLTKVYPSIYNEWPCVRCGKDIETFQHMWLCEEVRYDLLDIVASSQNLLKKLIIENLSEDVHVTSNTWDVLFALSIWNVEDINPEDYFSPFNFIDLIKGIIPYELVDLVKSTGIKQSSVYTILKKLQDQVMKRSCNEIYNITCELTRIFTSQILNIPIKQRDKINKDVIEQNLFNP